MSSANSVTGGCLCGAVGFAITGPMRDVINCHCGQCRRSHGHYAAYAATNPDNLTFTEDRGLKWYQSSDAARRGFCTECGSSLFWKPVDKPHIAVAAGSLDQPTGLTTTGDIFTDDMGDYYVIDDGRANWPGTMADEEPS
jgi:hypothetical protein